MGEIPSPPHTAAPAGQHRRRPSRLSGPSSLRDRMAAEYIFTMHKVTRFYPPDREVLKDITLSFYPGAKIGVLGANGAGKSSLLQDHGRPRRRLQRRGPPRRRVSASGCSNRSRTSTRTRRSTTTSWTASARSRTLLTRYDEVLAAWSDPEADYDKLGDEQAELERKIEAANAWDLQRNVEIAMDALRLPPGDADVTNLSGGERRRVALCRLLLSRPTCCCSTSPPTTSTPSRWPGSSGSCRTTPAPSWPSPTTATSSTTSPAGSSNSTAAGASLTRATTRAGSSRSRSGSQAGGEPGLGPPTDPGPRARMGAHGPQGPPGQGQGPPRRLRQAPRRGQERRGPRRRSSRSRSRSISASATW